MGGGGWAGWGGCGGDKEGVEEAGAGGNIGRWTWGGCKTPANSVSRASGQSRAKSDPPGCAVQLIEGTPPGQQQEMS